MKRDRSRVTCPSLIACFIAVSLAAANAGCDADRILVGNLPSTDNTGGSSASSQGGAATGGVAVTGGTLGAGGRPNTGGFASTGGSPGLGGAPTGGGGSAIVPVRTSSACNPIDTSPGTLNLCGRTTSVAFSADGGKLAIALDGAPEGIFVWAYPSGALLQHITAFGDPAYHVEFSPDGQRLVAAGMGPDVQIFDVQTGGAVLSLPVNCGFYADAATFSPDGTLVATSGFNGTVEVWRATDGARVSSLSVAASVHNLHFSPDGKRLVASSTAGGKAIVFNMPSGEVAYQLNGIADEMADAVFSPDGSLIASTGPNNAIRVWSGADGQLLATLPAHVSYVSHVVWVDNSRFLTDDWSGITYLWSLSAGGSFSVAGKWNSGAQALGMAIAPGGQVFAVGGGQSAGSGASSQGFAVFALP